MVLLIYSDPVKAGKTNSIWSAWRKAKLHRSPMGFLSHSTSPFTSCGAELQWSYASFLASFPFANIHYGKALLGE